MLTNDFLRNQLIQDMEERPFINNCVKIRAFRQRGLHPCDLKPEKNRLRQFLVISMLSDWF